MSAHLAMIRWKRGKAPFLQHQYSRVHDWHFDGGAQVQASPSPSIVAAPHGDPDLVDPEEAFVAALASCHMLFFLDFCSRNSVVVDCYEDHARGILGRNAAGRMAITEVILHPAVALAPGMSTSPETLLSLHHKAHEHCFLANSVSTEIKISPKFDSTP